MIRYLLMLFFTAFVLITNAQERRPFTDLQNFDNRILTYAAYPAAKNLQSIRFGVRELNFFSAQYFAKFKNAVHVQLEYKNEQELNALLPKLLELTNLKYLELDGQWSSSDTVRYEIPAQFSKLKKLQFLSFKGPSNIDFEKSLPKLKKLTNLKTLLFDAYYVKKIPNAISQLKNLENLGLVGQKIEKLPDWITDMDNLKGIMVGLYSVDYNDTVKKLSQLDQLQTLIWNSLTISSTSIDTDLALKGLEALFVDYGSINNPDVLFNLLAKSKQLKQLSLKGVVLKQIPAVISNNKELTHLTISNTRSTLHIPEAIGELENLVFIDFSSDTLSTLPNSLAKLKKLHTLDINYANLVALPSVITELVSLKTLKINGNKLNTLPANFGNLKQLTFLDASANPLKELPLSFAHLQNLVKLNLNYCDLKDLPQNFERLSSLQELELEDNFIYHLSDSFVKLLSLNRIGMANNALTKLPNDIGALSNLRYANFASNNIAQLPHAISELKKLEELDISNNNLNSLPQALGNLTSIKKIYLQNNPVGRRYTAREIYRKDAPKPIRTITRNNIKYLPKNLAQWYQIKNIYLSGLTTLDEIELFRSLFTIGSKGFAVELEDANITQLPQTGWKNFNIGVLNLRNNKVQVLPSDIKNAPYLIGYNLNNNRLPTKPINYNSYAENKFQKLIWFKEFGFITANELPKVDSMALAYIEKSATHYYRKEFQKSIESAELAMNIDSALATAKLYQGNLGEAKYQTGDYKGAIENLTKAIKRDTAGGIRIMNLVEPDFTFRAKSYLKLGDTIKAIQDYEILATSFGENKWADVAILYRKIKKEEDARKAFSEAIKNYKTDIDFNKKQKHNVELTQLSLLELVIISEDFLSAEEYAQELKKEIMGTNNLSLLAYLTACAKIANNNADQVDFKQLQQNILTNKNDIQNWSYTMFLDWLNITTIEKTKIDSIRQLTNSIAIP